MKTQDFNVAARYSKALFQVAAKENLEEISRQLKEISTALAQPDIEMFFHHPRTTLKAKQDLVISLELGAPLEPFLLLVAEKGRLPLLHHISRELERLVHDKFNTTSAYIRTAVPLNQKMLKKIHTRLEHLTGKKILPIVCLDPKIWGGLTVEIDGKIIDLSLVDSFRQLTKSLLVN